MLTSIPRGWRFSSGGPQEGGGLGFNAFKPQRLRGGGESEASAALMLPEAQQHLRAAEVSLVPEIARGQGRTSRLMPADGSCFFQLNRV